MNILVPVSVVAVLGLALGSFLNVCIVRIPNNESIIAPRSHCPACGHPIRWYDNIPVLSFLLLGGRCRDCQQPISMMYPLVEVLTSAVLTLAFWRYRLSPEFFKAALLSSLLIVLIFTDFHTRRLPHKVTIFGIATGVLLSFVTPVDDRPFGWLLARQGIIPGGPWLSLLGGLGGAAVGGGMFYAVGEAFYYVGGRRKEYLGFGDVMLMLMVGTFLGIPLTFETILLGSLGGTLIAVPLSLASSKFRDYPWPYGTFLGAAGIVVCLIGDRLFERYLIWAGLA